MILVDTSIWIDHLNTDGDRDLQALFASESVVTHPFVIGEIALGSIRNRKARLALLADLPQVPIVRDAEVRLLIEANTLFATKLGYVDAHLLASAVASSAMPSVRLWTRDKALHAQAVRLKVAYTPEA